VLFRSYYHFQDKEKLYLATVAYSFNRRLPPLMAALERFSDPWDRLSAFITAFTALLAADTDFQRLMQWVLLDTSDERAEILTRSLFAPFFDEITGLMQKLAPGKEAHWLAVSIIGLAVFPFETSFARRLIPGYRSPRQHPGELAGHILALLQGSQLRRSSPESQS
jgi:AcrR family transcriptional regulator